MTDNDIKREKIFSKELPFMNKGVYGARAINTKKDSLIFL